MHIYKLFLALMAVLLISCGTEDEKPVEQTFIPLSTDESSDLNIIWKKEEQFLIDQFVKNEGWEMIETGTGLRYMIYENGSEDAIQAEARRVAWVEFEIAPMGDTIVYKSTPGVAESFLVEMDHVENGLHEAITYMKVGDRAKIILPQHLAHGLLGDQNKIPPLTAVVYDLKLLAVE